MPELKNTSELTLFIPGADITLEPGATCQISDEQAAAIKSPSLSVSTGAEPSDTHETQTPSEVN